MKPAILKSPLLQSLITPGFFLIIATATNQASFASWQTLINNFGRDVIHATGADIGMQQSIREIPGLLSFTASFILLFMREQTLALISLCLLGLGTALTTFFPTLPGFFLTTLLMSVGFHYYETMNQSLSLQWFDKKEAPVFLARVIASSSAVQIGSFLAIFLFSYFFHLSYTALFVGFGIIGIVASLFLSLYYPWFPQHTKQNKGLVIRKRYWLYYALNFMTGARRQIFVVFAAWLMVEKFNYDIEHIAGLFLINAVFNTMVAAKVGRLILRFGERNAIALENICLIFIFIAYAFVEDPITGAALYVVDNTLFSLAIAQRTYFQKIADPADIAPSSGVAFTINHIAAVFLPALLGLVWLSNPSLVFYCAAVFCVISLILAAMMPRHPGQGEETIFTKGHQTAMPAPASPAPSPSTQR